MKSLHASYVEERRGNLLHEESWGFVEYNFAPPYATIIELFVAPAERGKGRGRELVERVTQEARTRECTSLLAQVWTKARNATYSLAASLAVGFTVQGVQGDCIILEKRIEG